MLPGLSGRRKAVRSARRSSQLRARVSRLPQRHRPQTWERRALPPCQGALPSQGPGPQGGRGRGFLRPGRWGRGRPEAVAGSARATASRAMEPRESGKVGLEGPWGRPLSPRGSPICSAERRAARAESLRMSQPCRGRLARSPAASSALGQVAQGGASSARLRAPRRRPAPLALRAEPPLRSGRSAGAGGGRPAQPSGAKALPVCPQQLGRFAEALLGFMLGGWIGLRGGGQRVAITQRPGAGGLELRRSLFPRKGWKEKIRHLACFLPTSDSSIA